MNCRYLLAIHDPILNIKNFVLTNHQVYIFQAIKESKTTILNPYDVYAIDLQQANLVTKDPFNKDKFLHLPITTLGE